MSHVCKVWRLNVVWNFAINYSKIWFIGIFYNAIMHKYGFGQTYWTNLLKRILKKFRLYFSKFYSIYYDFLKCKQFFCNIKPNNDFWKKINEWIAHRLISARGFATVGWHTTGSSPRGLGHGARLSARTRHHRATIDCGGSTAMGSWACAV
jgi:hypothetical protein